MSRWSIGDIDEDLREFLVEDVGPPQASNTEDLADIFINHSVEERKEESPKPQINANEELADRFVNHTVGKKLKQKQKKRKTSPNLQSDQTSAAIVQLIELFPQYDEQLIKRIFQTNNSDFERTVDELANASTVCTQFLADIPDKPVAPQTVFAPVDEVLKATVVFPNLSIGASTSRKWNLDETEGSTQRNVRNGIADGHEKKAIHYRNMASSAANRSTQMAYLALASDEDKKKAAAQQEEDAATAKTITLSLDLHGYEIKRALNLLQLSIESVRKRKPNQKRMEIVTGWGANNPQSRSVLKPAVYKWLQQYEIKVTVQDYNPGALTIDLFSVQKWW